MHAYYEVKYGMDPMGQRWGKSVMPPFTDPAKAIAEARRREHGVVVGFREREHAPDTCGVCADEDKYTALGFIPYP